MGLVTHQVAMNRGYSLALKDYNPNLACFKCITQESHVKTAEKDYEKRTQA